MNEAMIEQIPPAYAGIRDATIEMKFNMASDLYTGNLLKTLAASKPGGKFLELGTGTGLATAWLVAGMDINSSLLTIENNELLLSVARKYITDDRVEFILTDASEWITSSSAKFDFIFADAMPGKYELFDETINLLNNNGYYIIDDMLPQPNWPAGHADRVDHFIHQIGKRLDLHVTKLAWSTGIMIVVKK